mgnify:FL=1
MSDTKAMQRLCGLMRKAVQQYEMLAPATAFWWAFRAARTA